MCLNKRWRSRVSTYEYHVSNYSWHHVIMQSGDVIDQRPSTELVEIVLFEVTWLGLLSWFRRNEATPRSSMHGFPIIIQVNLACLSITLKRGLFNVKRCYHYKKQPGAFWKPCYFDISSPPHHCKTTFNLALSGLRRPKLQNKVFSACIFQEHF